MELVQLAFLCQHSRHNHSQDVRLPNVATEGSARNKTPLHYYREHMLQQSEASGKCFECSIRAQLRCIMLSGICYVCWEQWFSKRFLAWLPKPCYMIHNWCHFSCRYFAVSAVTTVLLGGLRPVFCWRETRWTKICITSWHFHFNIHQTFWIYHEAFAAARLL